MCIQLFVLLAGIDMGSDSAREILQAAKVSTSVIEGVKKLGDKAAQRNMVPMGKKGPVVDLSVINTIDENGQLIGSSVGSSVIPDQPASTANTSEAEEELPTLRDLRQRHKQEEEEDMVCICQRCFRLQQYGQVSASLSIRVKCSYQSILFVAVMMRRRSLRSRRRYGRAGLNMSCLHQSDSKLFSGPFVAPMP